MIKKLLVAGILLTTTGVTFAVPFICVRDKLHSEYAVPVTQERTTKNLVDVKLPNMPQVKYSDQAQFVTHNFWFRFKEGSITDKQKKELYDSERKCGCHTYYDNNHAVSGWCWDM